MKIVATLAGLAFAALLLGAATVPQEAPEDGSLCVVTTANNVSVHPGNVLVVQTGPDTIRISGVEDVKFTVTETEFTSAGPISSYVEINSDTGRTSLEWDIECTPPPPTTTTTTTEPVPPPSLIPPVSEVPPTTSIVVTPPPPTTSLPPTPVSPPTPGEPNYTG